jgi:hypothetical protein
MERPRSLKDILSGLIFIGCGLAFGIAASGYPIGTALRMGPGYFPLVLAGTLVALGAAIVAKGLLARASDGELGTVPWRGVALLTAALVFFGATVRGLGLAPALFATAFAASMASRHNSWAGAALLAAALTLFCVLIFSVGLGVPVPLIGPWLRF